MGFAGGTLPSPTYEQVCTKKTGHAETVEVIYDTRQLSTVDLLREFFSMHDFTVDRRANGGQYRSAIFLSQGSQHAKRQGIVAKKFLDFLTANGWRPATEISRQAHFYPAAARHQQYCAARDLTPKKRNLADVREILTLFTG